MSKRYWYTLRSALFFLTAALPSLGAAEEDFAQISTPAFTVANGAREAGREEERGCSSQWLFEGGEESEEQQAEEEERIRLASYNNSSHRDAYHYVLEVSEAGDRVTLWDLSQWVIDPEKSSTCKQWRPADEVVIAPYRPWIFKSRYKFKLVHRVSGKKVKANMVRGPLLRSPLCRYILSIDYEKGQLWLNDGSYWKVSKSGNDQLKEWRGDDEERHVVMIGINDSWTSLKPNILINVSRYSYLPACCY